MRITLLGVLAFVVVAALLVYAGYELQRASQERNAELPRNPNSPLQS